MEEVVTVIGAAYVYTIVVSIVCIFEHMWRSDRMCMYAYKYACICKCRYVWFF